MTLAITKSINDKGSTNSLNCNYFIFLPTKSAIKAISEVVAAEEAAKTKDGNKVVRHLKSGGKWVLTTARDIGVKLVTEVIKSEVMG